MKLKLYNHNRDTIPEELKSPTYFIDDEQNHFIDEFSKQNKFLESIEKHLGDKNNDPFNSTGFIGEFEINTINFFIGANNSGKSRLLRGLLKLDLNNIILYEGKFFIDLLDKIEEPYLRPEQKTYLTDKKLDIKKIKKQLIEYYQSNDSQFLIDNIKNEISSLEEINTNNRLEQYLISLSDIIKETEFSKKNKISEKNYIPILRSLYKTSGFDNYSFKDITQQLFFDGKEDVYKNVNIHTGLELWQKIYDLNNTTQKRKLDKFCSFLGNTFFEGKKVELLANTKGENLISIAINNGEFRDVNTIGDGIQTLIILLFPIFMADDNEVFYIEEPEMNLHPAYQRIFIETLLNNKDLKAKNLKYFFTTHSNHFLDLTLMNDDVSFFQFQKIEEGKHLIKSKIKPDKEILESLGVNTSSVLLANTSIWVEGPTDRKYISKFLKLYCDKEQKPHLKEDIDFAFFEYGGNLIAHYLFDEEQNVDDNTIKEKINAFSSANRIYLLADNDNVQEGDTKYNRQKTLESISSTNKYFKYQNTVVKEIENLLPVKIISDFTSNLLMGDDSKQKAKKLSFKKSDYDTIGLGEFYETLFSENDINKPWRKFKVDSNSGTLKSDYKTKLANFVLDSDYTYDELIEDNDNLKTIIENLYNFIKNDTNRIQK